MEKYFNDEQIDYVRDLAASPEKVCVCGWYWRDECSRRCNCPEKQRPTEKHDAQPSRS